MNLSYTVINNLLITVTIFLNVFLGPNPGMYPQATSKLQFSMINLKQLFQ